MKKKMFGYEEQRYSIRKYSFGVASVLIGCLLFMGNQAILADETVTPNTTSGSTQPSSTTDVSKAGGSTTDISSTISETSKSQSVTSSTAASETDSVISQVKPTEEVVVKEENQTSTTTETKPTQEESLGSTVAIPKATDQARVVSADEVTTAPEALPTTSEYNLTSNTENSVKNIPNQGNYTYTERTEVKNQPSISAPVEFYVNASDKIYYDQVLMADGYQWISYNSYNGTRRYAAITELAKENTKPMESKVTGNITVQNVTSQGFDVFVTNVSDSNGITTVKVPIWTTNGDQDDTIWYDGVKQSNGDYKVTVAISDHKNERGEYNVHLYYQEPSGKMQGVGAQKVTVPEQSTDSQIIPASGSYVFTQKVEVKDEPKVSAETQFTFEKGFKLGYYDKVIEADNYQWISYVSYGGIRRYIPVATLTNTVKPERTGTISIENQASGDFNVIVSGVSDNKSIAAVKVPVWTTKGDQDDIIWYDAIKQSDGTYRANVKLSDHRNERGEYNVHLYYVESDGTVAGVSGIKTTVAEVKPERTGTISIENQASGDFNVIISGVSDNKSIAAVKVPVWTTKGDQDDIIWYDAIKQSDGTYRANVKLSDHRNERGEYNVHLYYVESDGTMAGVAATKNTVVATSENTTNPIIEAAQGTYTFEGHTEVRNEAQISSSVQFYFNQGDYVSYDRILTVDGHKWISYTSFSGIRRYVIIN